MVDKAEEVLEPLFDHLYATEFQENVELPTADSPSASSIAL